MRNRLNICECALNSFTILRRGFQRDSVLQYTHLEGGIEYFVAGFYSGRHMFCLKFITPIFGTLISGELITDVSK